VKRVLILTFTEVVTDPRVMRHVRALRDEFAVVTCGVGPEPEGVASHVELPPADHLPRTPSGLAFLALRQARRAYGQLPAANEARRALAGADFDLAIANDITAVPVAYEAAAGRPVIADLHEYAPRQFEGDWRWRLMVQPFNEALCRIFLPKMAAVTTVGDGIAEEYRRNYGVDCLTITNAAPFRDPQPRAVGPVIRAVHSGGAQPDRQLELMISAAAGIPSLTLDLYLVVSHMNRPYLDLLRQMAGQTRNVRVLDPVPMEQLPATLDDYDVGIYVLPPTSFNTSHALPNKFFDFVQSGLGIIIGPSPEMASLTRRYGLGEVLPDFAESSLRSALTSLDADALAEWKAASSRAAAELSSESQAERLRDLVRRLH
jgi:hypothetical protein